MAVPLPSSVAADRRVVKATAKIFEHQPDRRSSDRRPFVGPVTLTLDCAPNVQLSALAKDVSSLGIGLFHLMPLDPGEMVAEVQLPSGGSISFRLQILWCKN